MDDEMKSEEKPKDAPDLKTKLQFFTDKETGNKIGVEILHPQAMWNIFVKNKDGDRIGGAYALLVEGSEYPILLDVIIYNPEDRHKGFGTGLMQFLTSYFKMLVTGFSDSSSIGRKLCLDNGFELKVDLKGNKPAKWLVWVNKDAVKHGFEGKAYEDGVRKLDDGEELTRGEPINGKVLPVDGEQ